MKPLTAGRVARRLLAFYDNKPERWTQHWFARNKDGVGVDFSSPEATCFCALGALASILRPDASEERRLRYREAAEGLRDALGRTPARVNDSCISFFEFKTELKKIARLP